MELFLWFGAVMSACCGLGTLLLGLRQHKTSQSEVVATATAETTARIAYHTKLWEASRTIQPPRLNDLITDLAADRAILDQHIQDLEQQLRMRKIDFNKGLLWELGPSKSWTTPTSSGRKAP